MLSFYNHLCAALMFFTRLPVAGWFQYQPEYTRHLALYFPVVGIVVGTLLAGVFMLLALYFPLTLTVLLTLVFGLLLTGALHEDGFADACDGFGGGRDAVHILAIMKDSLLGSYGVLGLMLLILLKSTALFSLGFAWVPLLLIVAHGVSRAVAATLVYSFDYVQEDSAKKVAGLDLQLQQSGLMVVLAMGVVLLLLLALYAGMALSLVLVGVLLVLRWWFGSYLLRRIGGYTGDCLGACQQLAEVLILVVAAAWLGA